MILCIMVIVGGMARFFPALIYRRFIFETRSVGGVLALTAYNAYFRCSHEIARLHLPSFLYVISLHNHELLFSLHLQTTL